MPNRRLVPLIGVGVALLAGGITVAWAAQRSDCRSGQPAVGPHLSVTNLPLLKNFDPCSGRLTMTDDALKATPGPYISQAEAERLAVGSNTPTKVRSFLVTATKAHDMLNSAANSTDVYPDRMVWLVVVRAPDQGAKPSVAPGVKPWPRRYYFTVIDAASGRFLWGGGNEPDGGDWPVGVPQD